MISFVLVFLFLDAVWLHRFIFPRTVGGRPVEMVEQELVEVLVKTKEAMEAEPPMEEIQHYADRFKVLLVR